MRAFSLAALTAAALTAGVARADITENLALTYQSGATFDGTMVVSDDFTSILTSNGTLSGYDPGIQGFLGVGYTDPITADVPFNLNLSPNTFFCQLFDGPFGNNWLE